jgi:peroxiredoxin
LLPLLSSVQTLPPRCRRRRRGLAQTYVVVFFAIAGILLLGVSSLTLPWRRYSASNIAAEAKDYLRQRDVKPLAQDLDAILVHAEAVPTLPHPLLGRPAPDFELNDSIGRPHALSEHFARGPVVLVFYYGYYCNHCVGQLFALGDDIAKFHDLGAEVVAISPDSSEETSKKFAKYGAFAFPVLSDPDNKVATAWSVFAPRTPTTPEILLHGTFIIDRSGVVRWYHYRREPFTDNAALLLELAKMQEK